jgi:hypothetical protein
VDPAAADAIGSGVTEDAVALQAANERVQAFKLMFSNTEGNSNCDDDGSSSGNGGGVSSGDNRGDSISEPNEPSLAASQAPSVGPTQSSLLSLSLSPEHVRIGLVACGLCAAVWYLGTTLTSGVRGRHRMMAQGLARVEPDPSQAALDAQEVALVEEEEESLRWAATAAHRGEAAVSYLCWCMLPLWLLLLRAWFACY